MDTEDGPLSFLQPHNYQKLYQFNWNCQYDSDWIPIGSDFALAKDQGIYYNGAELMQDGYGTELIQDGYGMDTELN